jgi:hypothetical protein
MCLDVMRRLELITPLAVALISLTACTRNPMQEDVSLLRLISTPERFDGKPVRVIGYVRIEFEGNAIYLHQEDYEHFIPTNGLRLDDPACFQGAKHDERFTSGYAYVVGTFKSNRPSELNIWSGTISNISLCTRAPSIAEMNEGRPHENPQDLRPKT